jgi:hypothetical protein
MVYECTCGSTSFWIKADMDMAKFAGLVCRKCEDYYKFPEPLLRKNILIFEKQGDWHLISLEEK